MYHIHRIPISAKSSNNRLVCLGWSQCFLFKAMSARLIIGSWCLLNSSSPQHLCKNNSCPRYQANPPFPPTKSVLIRLGWVTKPLIILNAEFACKCHPSFSPAYTKLKRITALTSSAINNTDTFHCVLAASRWRIIRLGATVIAYCMVYVNNALYFIVSISVFFALSS